MTTTESFLPLPQQAADAFAAGHLLAGAVTGNTDNLTARFYSYSPLTDTPLLCHFPEAGAAELDAATGAAAAAFYPYSTMAAASRAVFLRAIASEIDALGDLLVEAMTLETGLPAARALGERGRTVNQLRLFADLIEQPADTVYLPAQPERTPLPAPELCLTTLPLGPVAVFAASNFPLAFSVAGGDTAAALAAGCPVIVKAHNAHPLTSYLVAVAIEQARRNCNQAALTTTGEQIPAGAFQLLFAREHALSEQLIQHPVIKAVAFTGSVPLGLHFQRLIQSRPEPVPFYGELGSQNPLLLLPDYAQTNSAGFARELLTSVLQGNGQFCTRPGLVFVPHAALDALLTPLVAGIEACGPAVLLTPKIAAGYRAGCAQLAALAGIREIAVGRASGAGTAETARPETARIETARIETGSKVLPRLFLTEAARWSQLPELQQEIFGPATVLISYQRLCELTPVLASLHGQLTATVYGSDADFAQSGVHAGVNSGVGSGVNSGVNSGMSNALPAQPTANQPSPGVTPPLLWQLAQKAGRIIRNQMPTGVEVCAAMNHGGPFPASTDLRYTAVGSSAIRRFQRPLCQQNLG